MSTVFYDREDVAKWLGAKTVEVGRKYVKAVANLHWNRNTLSADVQGSQRQPYGVEVKFHDIGDDLWVEGTCTCPVGFQCKHMAAVLIAALDDSRAEESVRPQL